MGRVKTNPSNSVDHVLSSAWAGPSCSSSHRRKAGTYRGIPVNSLAPAILAIWVASFLLPGQLLAGDPKVKKQDPAIFFWYHFRSAVANDDLSKIQGLSLFPFETARPDGTLVKNSKNQFPELIKALLDTPGSNGKTTRDFIIEKQDLTNEERSTLKGKEIQVGLFRIRTVKNKCWLVGAAIPGQKEMTPGTSPRLPEKAPPPPPAAAQETAAPEPETLVNLAAPPPPLQKPPSRDNAEAAPVKDLPPPAEGDPNKEGVFRLYWVEFRKAALDNNVSKIKSLTRFPFETKGPLEDDRTKDYVAREFDLLWPRLLETDPHSWGPLRDSMKELIERREEPSVEEISTEPSGQVQIGVFVFRKLKKRWRFTRAIVPQ